MLITIHTEPVLWYVPPDNGEGFLPEESLKEGHALGIIIERIGLNKKADGISEIMFEKSDNNTGCKVTIKTPFLLIQ